jgi:hypothetical protein
VKLLRIALLIVLTLVIITGGFAAFLYRNQDRLVKLMLARVDDATGLHVSIASSSLQFRSHLVLLLEAPEVYRDGIEVARFNRVIASVSYHNLIRQQGLPLRRLRLEQATLTVPADALAGGAAAIPRLDAELRRSIAAAFAALGGVTQGLEISDATVKQAGVGPLAEEINLNVYHRRSHADRWYLRFEGNWTPRELASVRVGGAIAYGRDRRLPQDIILHGELRGGDSVVRKVRIATLTLHEHATARLRFALHQDGRLSGNVSAILRDAELQGEHSTTPVALGDFALRFPFDAGTASFDIPALVIEHDQTRILQAKLRLDDPYSENSIVTIAAYGLRADLLAPRKFAGSLARLPKAFAPVIDAIHAGEIAVNRAELSSPLHSILDSPGQVLRQSLTANGALENVAIKLPSEWGVPELTHLAGKLSYSNSAISFIDGSTELGKSKLSPIGIRVDIGPRPDHLKYSVESRGELDAAEVYGALLKFEPTPIATALHRIRSVQGKATFDFRASGVLATAKPSRPAAMAMRLTPEPLQVAMNGLSAPLELTGGVVTVIPTSVTIDRVTVRAAGDGQGAAGNGSVLINGLVEREKGSLITRHVSAEVRDLSAQRWLPLAIDPSDLKLQGRINGVLFVEGAPAAKPEYRVNGRLTVGQGEMQFGFLRSPIILSSATLALDGRGMKLQIPSAMLEKSPIDLSMSIRDFSHPEMELNALAKRLDLTVMKFIRLPWQPPTPVMIFKIPVTGYIGARRANLVRLEMNGVGANYRYDGGNWWVRGFKADALGGKIALDLSGRKKDDWVHMRGQLMQIDGAELMHLLQGPGEPKLTGKMDMNGDFWADTNNDFFPTLSGKLAINAQHGTLAKFRLLSRILGMIDLKSWLTANIPDPRVAGLPFDTLTATFNGNNGVFHTDDLTLKGPVMDLGAQGSVNADQATMNMTIAMVPFNTVNWLVTKIPLLGERLAAGTTLFAAYFQVHGPISDPGVTVKPITSVAELVKKTLGLPINIIRPNTVR